MEGGVTGVFIAGILAGVTSSADDPVIRLPSPCLVVLVGPSGSGKSTWATEHFAPGQIVSSDRLRAVVGEGEHDLAASPDAFYLLDLILTRRLKRRLTTVVDSMHLDLERRTHCLALAAELGVPCVAITFDVDPTELRARNRRREHPIAPGVLGQQIQAWEMVKAALPAEGFAAVHAAGPVAVVPGAVLAAPEAEAPAQLRFGLQIPIWNWPGGPAELAGRLRSIAAGAEEAGVHSLWVRDHFRQIPTMGPAWADMPESYTTLGFLAAATERVRLGTLVTGITYRNVAHLGKIVATLDVLSGGRAMCGLGAAWFQEEHEAYGFAFPPVGERFDLLEDALQLLPLLWGPGTPAFEGKVLSVPEAMCYPRPLQDRIPILVGGSGERRTLRLAAQYADACNLFGDADVVRRKVSVLRRHCADVGRDPAAVEVTQLGTVLVGRDRGEVSREVDRLRPARVGVERFMRYVNAGTVADHVARLRGLAAAGVQTAIVSLSGLGPTDPIERFAEVITAVADG
jgi:F420-dependent oxidoreductase-like protein